MKPTQRLKPKMFGSASGLPDIALGSSIPRIIHQNFFEGWDAIPRDIAENVAELRARNPEWEYRFHDSAAAEAFIGEIYGGDVLKAYRRIDPAHYAARSDLHRYLLLYAEGGVYLDIKSAATRPLDKVIRPDDLFILSQWRMTAAGMARYRSTRPELAHVQGGAYLQWFIITAPGHPFLKAVIEAVLRNIDEYRVLSRGVGRNSVLRLTGPIAFALAIAPLRRSCPHRYVDYETDLGFAYSSFGDHKTHRQRFGRHYSQLQRPIVKQDFVTATAARVWFGAVQPRVDKLKQRLARIAT